MAAGLPQVTLCVTLSLIGIRAGAASRPVPSFADGDLPQGSPVSWLLSLFLSSHLVRRAPLAQPSKQALYVKDGSAQITMRIFERSCLNCWYLLGGA